MAIMMMAAVHDLKDGPNTESSSLHHAIIISLIQDLASARIDGIDSQKRNGMIQIVTDILAQNSAARSALANHGAIRCLSKFAYSRITKLYCVAILNEAETTTTTTSSSSAAVAAAPDKQEDQTIQTDTLQKLCIRLCELLQKAQDGKILDDCRKGLGTTKSSSSSSSSSSGSIIVSTLLGIAKSAAAAANTTTTTTTTSGAAVTIGCAVPALALVPSSDVDWNLFVQIITASRDPPAESDGDIALCRSILTEGMDATTWEETVGPAILLKVKAKPESVLGMVQEMTKYIRPTVLSSSKVIMDGFLPVLHQKFLKSPKETLRHSSSLMLQHVASAAIHTLGEADESMDENTASAVSVAMELLNKLVTCLADTKSLTQPHQRHVVYRTLGQIGSTIVQRSNTGLSHTVSSPSHRDALQLDSDVVSTVLGGICAPLTKEAKTATDNRQSGLEALLAWIVVAIRNGGPTGTSCKGYEDALAYIRKPVISVKDGADTVTTIGTMVEQVPPDIMENLVLHLWKEPQFVQGVELIIGEANKKHASSSSVAPVDGLLAVYLSMVYAIASSSKLPSFVDKALSAGSFPLSKTSFVYGSPITTAVSTSSLVSKILPQIIAMYTKLVSTSDGDAATKKMKSNSASVAALVCCITHPTKQGSLNPAQSIESSIQTVLDYMPISDAIAEALFDHVNRIALESHEALAVAMNATRQAREEEKVPSIKGKCSPTGNHRGSDVNAVRRLARMLLSCPLTASNMARIMILLHLGTSVKAGSPQRTTLVKDTTSALKSLVRSKLDKQDETVPSMATVIVEKSTFVNPTDGENVIVVSKSIHLAARSLILSLGNVASNFNPSTDDPEDDEMKPSALARALLSTELCPRLANNLSLVINEIESLSSVDVAIYRSSMGTLYKESDMEATSVQETKDTGKGRRTEEEEWELQVKKELARKKENVAAEGVKPLSAEDKKRVQEQDEMRTRIAKTIDVKYRRSLATIESFVQSDIEIGNSCLPMLSPGVLKMSVAECPVLVELPFLKDITIRSLSSLASCVYEIQDEYASMMAIALTISCRPSKDSTSSLGDKPEDSIIQISPLPSPCEPAATTIFEMDEFQEELSGASFVFLFPILRAALMGPRTTPGCEGALRVLERHTIMLSGRDSDPHVKPLRTEMVMSVLELLKHDRAQAFVDPNPYDTLIACYQTDDDEDNGISSKPVLSTAELAPLLDERGALGMKNCRVAAMMVLGSIAKNHLKIVKNNPLIENRIWLNCFDENESIRSEARLTWGIIHGEESIGDKLPAPSTMYAIPLLPLLHCSDTSIAAAAAKAYAHGMKSHPNSVSRNVTRLCGSYIDSCPQLTDDDDASSTTSALSGAGSKAALKAPPPAVKKPLVPASLKKKTVKKSALEVAGIGQPKKKTTKKQTALTAALLKPKQERTLDQDALESQFKTGPTKEQPEKDSKEKISVRLGILRALGELPAAQIEIDIETLTMLASFLMAYGIADPDENVNNASRNTLRDVIAVYGASDEAILFLLPHLDDILKKGSADTESLGGLSLAKIPHGTVASNRRKEGAVVALGSVSLHLKGPENAGKIDNSVDMLLASLKTPNEDIQASVSDALSKLMKKGNTQERLGSILDSLMKDCLDGKSTEARRGAAYGISAAVKGSGIATLKKFGIVTRLEEACGSGNSTSKEGSLIAIQLLCTRLGLLFEPYVIVLLPSLLKSFGDPSDSVRKAASHAVSLIMSKLSAHGVKLVMPAVLTAFDDSSWRTKQASINMLGSMSHLAPKQLASALPKVVPKLIEAFADTHPKVKSSAQNALDEISSVIRNPEIHEISSVLLKGLTDPANNTLAALEALIATEFLHAIDAPSLSLIVPILHRGLRDRSAATKRYGALITGNICTMINDPRDFVPYLPTLMPDLKASLLDPIPDVRSIAAKALGSLTRGLGEDTLPDLRPWLIEHLRMDNLSSAERSGAAQGLTEVLIASGSTVIESVMLDDILPLKSHPSPSTREGVLWVLAFLPPALGQGFTTMLDASLPALINGLSDDNEQVRDVAMRAGRVLIKSHGKVHFDKILPVLQKGMGDDDYRIRLSSLMLLGDLLSMLGGTAVLRTDGDTQDDIRRAEKAQAQLTLVLGIQTRNRVLSDVYLARSDNAIAVRQTAVQVWKTVVSVTARTLRQILQVLVNKVVSELASGDSDKTDVAGKCLGDIVAKLGDSVLPEIIPVLRNSLYDGDSKTRRGVCVGLSEVISSSTKDQIVRFIDIIVKVVQDAICDDDADVREMAASSFQNLYSLVGSRAMDEVVPALMVALESSDRDTLRRDRALNGLTGILSIRSRELLPYIIPKLIQQPITTNHAKSLSSIATVTGTTLYFHFHSIIPALVNDLAKGSHDDKEQEEAVRDCVRSVFANADEPGVIFIIREVVGNCSSDKAQIRKECCWMLEVVVDERKDEKDFYEQIPVIIRELIHRFNDQDTDVVKASNKAFAALSKYVPAEELVEHIEYLRNLIASMVSDARRRKGGVGDGEFLLPGFNIPKGLEPLLPIYQRGILYGTPTIREASAAGLGEVISLTSNKFLAGPLIIKMTGPLLRIVGDRNPSNVKIAILKTLGLILVKGGPALKAFVPQFQTTFVKALSDPSRQVRVEAIQALGLLMPLSTRVDPLVKELVSGSLGKGVAATGDGSEGIVVVQTATLEALAVVLEEGGTKAKLPDSIPSALEASMALLAHPDEAVREASGKVAGAACNILGPEKTAELVVGSILYGSAVADDDSEDLRHGKACAIRRIVTADVSKGLDVSVSAALKNLTVRYMKDTNLMVKEAGIVAAGAIIGRSGSPSATLRSVESDLLSLMGDPKQRLETHQSVARCLCLALQLAEVDSRVTFFGVNLLNACLRLAMSGSQRVQFAFNDVLWLALDVAGGQAGLDQYAATAMFDDTRQMKSVYSKVLVRMKKVTILDD